MLIRVKWFLLNILKKKYYYDSNWLICGVGDVRFERCCLKQCISLLEFIKGKYISYVIGQPKYTVVDNKYKNYTILRVCDQLTKELNKLK